MPFKIKLKKNKQQYNVASKSMFVLTVELLDSAMLECTLTADSTGRDCMDNVCQRLGLQQPDLFGLRYVSRRSYPKIRWVDLDRPLKKQLDKYAQERNLYLSVMFYVNDVSLLEDEVTRYHYFLQLKLDVIEGRLRCNYEQAIVLASYSLQAEFGDHDAEKHTLEYLQDFPLLPKPMMAQFPEDKLSTLTDAIISQHANLAGIAQQLAEVYYIVGAQQLDGYGQECFLAKDERGNEVLIGASLTGIVVRRGNVSSPKFFKWHDITNLVNHKRFFGIECQNYELSEQFLLDEPDSAKYVWKMCVLQHTFYKMHASASESNELNITLEGSSKSQQQQQQLQQQQQHFHSGAAAAGPHHNRMGDIVLDPGAGLPAYPTTIQHSEIQNFHQQTQRVDLSPMKISNSKFSHHHHHHQLILQEQQQQASVQQQRRQQMMMDITANTTLQQSYNNYVLQHANSAGNVNESGYVVSNAHSVNDLDQIHNPPPQYQRPVPDYETAIRNKYGIVSGGGNASQPVAAGQHQHLPQQVGHGNANNNSSGNLAHSILYNSQPSLITDALMPRAGQPAGHSQQQQQQLVGAGHVGGNNILEGVYQNHHHLGNDSHNAYSSTPELNRVNLTHQQQQQRHLTDSSHDPIVLELQKLNLYRPPPPYPGPYGRLASTSTPDLAGGLNHGNSNNLSAAGGSGNVVGLGGSSPDLVSRRNLGQNVVNNHRSNFGRLHKTVENLHDAIESRQAFSSEELHQVAAGEFPHKLTAGYGVNREEQEEPIYQNQQQLLLKLKGEPIYENLPVHEKALYKQRLLEQQQRLLQQPREDKALDTSDNSNVLHIDDTVDSADPVQEAILSGSRQTAVDSGELKDVVQKQHKQSVITTTNKLKGHVSRVAITNSRENLSDSTIFRKDDNGVRSERKRDGSEREEKKSATSAKVSTPPSKPKRAVTKISIGDKDVSAPIRESEMVIFGEDEGAKAKRGDDNNSQPLSSSSKKDRTSIPKHHKQIEETDAAAAPVAKAVSKSQTMPNYFQTPEPAPIAAQQTPRTPSSKPRAGRKRWALNFGSKTGSLKSVKSDSGGSSHRSQNSLDGGSSTPSGSVSGSKAGGFGPMMLATLHGLTRSRPDLLAESMSAFSSPTGFSISPTSRVPKEELGAYLQAKLDEGEVLREFERIPRRKESSANSFRTASLAENLPRSRFRDVLPYEENRVRLSGTDRSNRTGFINASHISASVGQEQRFYIAAQSPLPNTLLHFWQMVLQCDVYLIVMLTDTNNSSGKSSSSSSLTIIPYWPQKQGSTLELGEFTIVKKFSSESEDGSYVTSTLHVSHGPTKTQRTVWHLQYTDWSDHGCPSSVPRYLEFLSEMSALRQHTAGEVPAGLNCNPPVLVHCSAGVGRTGVTILCDILLHCLDHNVDVDVSRALAHLRQQRMLMVQTLPQYKFVHTVLIHYLKQSRLI